MTDRKVTLSAPWMTYFHELEMLFKEDPQVKLEYEDYVITLYVEDEEKANALMKLLPVQKVFGNTVVNIDVVPSGEDINSDIELFKKAFKNNPILSYVTKAGELFPLEYVVFRNEVVQYYNDQLDDPNGNVSTLYQEIAKDVFGDNVTVHFCTDVPRTTKTLNKDAFKDDVVNFDEQIREMLKGLSFKID